MKKYKKAIRVCIVGMLSLFGSLSFGQATLNGKVVNANNEILPFATVAIKNSNIGTTTDAKGNFSLKLKAGTYSVIATFMGYNPTEKSVTLSNNQSLDVVLQLSASDIELDEVVVESTAGVSGVRKSAYNAVAIDATEMYNSSKNLSDALAKAPGIKMRESGGVGSDMNVMLDGFSGKHVKVFIDGQPQDGSGSSLSLNNLPVNMAESIEVYKGVVPVKFGTDAIGGVINVVTKKQRKGWHSDMSYTFGSFNTHKFYADWGISTEKGFVAMVKLIGNYSDNNYKVQTSVEDFQRNAINTKKVVTVRHFNDTYHNEAVQFKLGVQYKPWADRLLFGATVSNMYKEIQTGVRQIIVYGAKYRKGWSVEPQMEYSRNGFFNNHLDVSANVKYNHNSTTNVDTSTVKYNWYGETKKLNSPGEQSYQKNEAINNTWSAQGLATWRINSQHSIQASHTFNSFERENIQHLASTTDLSAGIHKITHKNISGLSYIVMPSERWNISAFAKYYRISVSGPMATTSNSEEYVKHTSYIDHWGYGAAGSVKMLNLLQLKLSYEKACRLPTIEEMFGDDDLESGDMSIKPEQSDNVNVSINMGKNFGRHGLYAEIGFVYRNTDDYIKRNIVSLSGGKSGASYVNYGNVHTKGFNASLRYDFNHRLSVGGNFTRMEVIDNQKTIMGSAGKNICYGERMPNIPYQFADADATYRWHNVGWEGNTLSLTYDNQYLHEFCYNAENVGTQNKRDFMVPTQFSHNASVTYSFMHNMFNLTFEASNFTNEQLYDNFSLQKAGRAFYGKIRASFGSNKRGRHHHRHHNNEAISQSEK